MGIATRLGPWLLGTVKETTGTTPGTIRNLGATLVQQTASYTTPAGVSTAATYNSGAIPVAVLPAGSVIHAIIVDVTTSFVGASGASLTFTTGNATTGLATNFASGVTLGAVTSGGTLGVARSTVSPNTGNIGLFANTGTSDLIVNLTFATGGNYTSGGSVNVQIVYAVRNPDGTTI